MYVSSRLAASLRVIAVAALPFWLAPAIATEADGDLEALYRTLDIRVTGGAAPGYVNDQACAYCHGEYQTYQAVAMAKSFYRPSADKRIEDFDDNRFFHAASGRYYELSLQHGDYWFKRYQLDEQGRPINLFERKVDWILGSGNHVRTYLYQTELGEMFQLPIAWYSQTGEWGMQPGYDNDRHQGVLRPIRRECMFCHNAYPDVPVGSDSHLEPHLFPRDLPEGTGCQRCHGPGEAHVRLVFGGETDLGRIRASVVNPGRLSPRRRDDVCFECHMLPTVAAPPVRRFGRRDYSFRPGTDLAEYQISFDIRESGEAAEERFEINHHPYRLLQSRCYRESDGRLSCLSCHDPHRKRGPRERADHYREICLGCHQDMRHPEVQERDCTICHMPQRRTRDVVRVSMTDHKIRIVPEGEDLMAPRVERDPVIEDILLLEPRRSPHGDLGEIYRVLGVLRPSAGASLSGLNHLERLLTRSPPDHALPYYDLARGLIRHRELARALKALDRISDRFGDTALSLAWRGIVHTLLKNREQAVRLLSQAARLDPRRPEIRFNLGLALLGLERWDAARVALSGAVELRPNLHQGWFYLGRMDEREDKAQSAAAHYRRALEIDPGHTRSYLGMARVLEILGQAEEAGRYLRHGARFALQPKQVRQALAELEEKL